MLSHKFELWPLYTALVERKEPQNWDKDSASSQRLPCPGNVSVKDPKWRKLHLVVCTVHALKLWLSAGAETQRWLSLFCVQRDRDCSPEGLWATGSLKLYLPSIGTSGVAGMDGDLKPSMLQVSMVCRAAFRVN